MLECYRCTRVWGFLSWFLAPRWCWRVGMGMAWASSCKTCPSWVFHQKRLKKHCLFSATNRSDTFFYKARWLFGRRFRAQKWWSKIDPNVHENEASGTLFFTFTFGVDVHFRNTKASVTESEDLVLSGPETQEDWVESSKYWKTRRLEISGIT